MKKLVLLIVLIVSVFGCFWQPQISEEDKHFENNLFSIDYPANWKYGLQQQKSTFDQVLYGFKGLKFEFKDPFYPKYNVLVSIIKKEKNIFSEYTPEVSLSEGAENFSGTMVYILQSKGFSVSESFGNLDEMIFNGMDAKKISLKIQEKPDKAAFYSNTIYFHHSGNQYQITYLFYPEFDAGTKSRIESIVYSFRPKE